ncbi:hypothetical protein PAMC26577_21680 [Caballeronia sordidicola]|uniref:Uncharacterized protein n=1 Tax=Caballeronia sordidicola TaxID=196367 RepID=A0A242MN32_CABSO|nr:hypothetical protein PAMC26577_21680 [Caballeronia sordidicola]
MADAGVASSFDFEQPAKVAAAAHKINVTEMRFILPFLVSG